MNFKLTIVTIVVAFFALTAPVVAQTDPMPSWSDTPTKQAIVAFVAKVTQAGGADFAPEEQRVAVFDVDGTLVPEMPAFFALIPVLAEIKEAVAKNSALGDKSMVAALLKGDYAALYEHGAKDLIAAAAGGKTTEEIVRNVLVVTVRDVD